MRKSGVRVGGAVVAALVASIALPGCSSVGGALSGVDFLSRERVGAVKTIAVLPFGFRAEGGGFACTLCPDAVELEKTSRSDAELATAFFYEALTRHPRFEVVPFERVGFLGTETMEAAAGRLRAEDGVDAVVVGALIELRPRVGDPRQPQARAAAALYAALVDPRSGERLWARRYYDEDKPPSGVVKQLRRLVTGDDVPTLTAHEVLHRAEIEMVAQMARETN